MRLLSMSANTIGAVDNLVGDLLRQRLAAALVYDHLGPLPRQTIEIEHRHMRTANPGWRELWTKVMITSTRGVCTRSTNRSSNSRVAGSLPCASLNTHRLSRG
jgi:hypothetical protein